MVRLRRTRSTPAARRCAGRTRPMSLSSSEVAASCRGASVSTSIACWSSAHRARAVPRRVLERRSGRRPAAGARSNQHTSASSVARDRRRVVGARRSCRRARRRGRRSSRTVTDIGGTGLVDRAVERVDRRRSASARRPGSTTTSSPTRSVPPATLAGVAAVVVVLVVVRAHDALHRQARVDQVAVGGDVDRPRGSAAAAGPSYQAMLRRALDDVVARAARRSG